MDRIKTEPICFTSSCPSAVILSILTLEPLLQPSRLPVQMLSPRSLPRVLLLLAALACAVPSFAGPPFVTDDPEPVELHHWEVYVASQQERDPSGRSGTLPHVEVNYGAAPNLQLHLIVPDAFSRPAGAGTTHGLGDTELGAKYRFVQETRHRPMIGTFTMLELPTGDADRGLGSGHLQVFVPIWLQKSWGEGWTSYGGGGYHTNPGLGNRAYWLAGWEIQREFGEHWLLGGELVNTTPTTVGGQSSLNANLGGQYNFDEGHHLLFSVGSGLHGDTRFLGYLGYQWTFGPNEPAK